MKIVIFGLTITSGWGNGHATTFRSLCKALARRGHAIVFIEKDVEWYANNRDLPNPEFCKLILYADWISSESGLLAEAKDADAVVIGSYFPDAIAAAKSLIDSGMGPLVFYDIDTPVTLAELRSNGGTAYLDLALIPYFDAYLSFSGGPSLDELETRFGARLALPFYCSVDPELYLPAASRQEFRCDMSYLGTFASDRQPKLMQLLNQPACKLKDRRFLVAGAMYPESTPWSPNVLRLKHVSPPDHAAFYSSARYSLNLTRSDMVAAGYSPSVRLFEASACGAAILSDAWQGLEDFLTPGEQILVVRDEQEVTEILLHLSDAERLKMGAEARERILAQHTSAHRAFQFEEIIGSLGHGRLQQEKDLQRNEGTARDAPPRAALESTLPMPAR